MSPPSSPQNIHVTSLNTHELHSLLLQIISKYLPSHPISPAKMALEKDLYITYLVPKLNIALEEPWDLSPQNTNPNVSICLNSDSILMHMPTAVGLETTATAFLAHPLFVPPPLTQFFAPFHTLPALQKSPVQSNPQQAGKICTRWNCSASERGKLKTNSTSHQTGCL